EQSFEDVRKYLLDEFSRIHRDHRDTMAAVPKPWPPPEVVGQLVRKSSGYFIYASTIIKFVDDKYFRPTDRLDIILSIAEQDDESPFGALDHLYTEVLSNLPYITRPRLLEILTVLAAKIDLRVSTIEKLLELKPGDVRLIFRGLHSVIRVPEYDDKMDVYHASFLDFLEDPTRSGLFYIGSLHRTNLVRHI
ncbi:hypothetical protein B0H11DRAFT_1625502, partial [Mycena galericulata]